MRPTSNEPPKPRQQGFVRNWIHNHRPANSGLEKLRRSRPLIQDTNSAQVNIPPNDVNGRIDLQTLRRFAQGLQRFSACSGEGRKSIVSRRSGNWTICLQSSFSAYIYLSLCEEGDGKWGSLQRRSRWAPHMNLTKRFLKESTSKFCFHI